MPLRFIGVYLGHIKRVKLFLSYKVEASEMLPNDRGSEVLLHAWLLELAMRQCGCKLFSVVVD